MVENIKTQLVLLVICIFLAGGHFLGLLSRDMHQFEGRPQRRHPADKRREDGEHRDSESPAGKGGLAQFAERTISY